MNRVPCARHFWLITSRGQSRGEPTVRVQCWLCLKRGRWPAAQAFQAQGEWWKYERRYSRVRNTT